MPPLPPCCDGFSSFEDLSSLSEAGFFSASESFSFASEAPFLSYLSAAVFERFREEGLVFFSAFSASSADASDELSADAAEAFSVASDSIVAFVERRARRFGFSVSTSGAAASSIFSFAMLCVLHFLPVLHD